MSSENKPMSQIDYSQSGANNFVMTFANLPTIPYFLRKVSFPTFSMAANDISIGKHNFKNPSNYIDTGEVVIQFNVDENWQNYFEILTWMFSVWSYQDNLKEVLFDATLILLNNVKQPIMRWEFIASCPTQVQGLEFDIDDTNPLVANVTLSYQYPRIIMINGRGEETILIDTMIDQNSSERKPNDLVSQLMERNKSMGWGK